MKGKDKAGKKTLFTNLLVVTCGLDIFENQGTSEKGCIEIEE